MITQHTNTLRRFAALSAQKPLTLALNATRHLPFFSTPLSISKLAVRLTLRSVRRSTTTTTAQQQQQLEHKPSIHLTPHRRAQIARARVRVSRAKRRRRRRTRRRTKLFAPLSGSAWAGCSAAQNRRVRTAFTVRNRRQTHQSHHTVYSVHRQTRSRTNPGATGTTRGFFERSCFFLLFLFLLLDSVCFGLYVITFTCLVVSCLGCGNYTL